MRTAATRLGAAIHRPRLVLLKCGQSPLLLLAAGFLLGSHHYHHHHTLYTGTEPWGALCRGAERPLRRPAESDLVWGTGAARAGGHGTGVYFSRETRRKQTACPELSSAVPCPNPKQTPSTKALVQHPPPRGAAHERVGERTSGASTPCSTRSHSWLPSLFL